MKKRIVILIVLTATLAMLTGSAGAEAGPVTLYYGDITLPSGGGFHWQPGTWDLNACPVTVSYKLDLSGAPNVAYTGNYGQSGYAGLVWPGSPWAGAWMSGFLCDWDNSGIEFPTYPDIDNSQDLDDKFNMQRSPYSSPWDETLYDVYCHTKTVAIPPFGSYSNYGIWFDRDGVDPWQANMWGMVNGGTYNTSGVYDVQITYDWSANYPTSKGTACATFFPTLQNNDAPGGYGIPTGFNRIPNTDPNYPGYYDFPAGISFDTDETKMANMRVFVSGNSGNGTIVVRDLTVTGCLVLEEGMATGGGWFIPEEGTFLGQTPGGKATFGFVAKQDDKKGSSGQLEFQYHADNLNLKSTSYEWVTLSNTQVIFEGEGALNDEPGYKFRVWAFDGDKAGGQPDRFTIRIWTGGGSFESPTYRAEGDLGGGQIVVHKK
jgi:hypothetical protein